MRVVSYRSALLRRRFHIYVLLVVQKEGTDRFHFAKPIPFLRNGERKRPQPVERPGPLTRPAVVGGEVQFLSLTYKADVP
jgi:hypothetical protein